MIKGKRGNLFLNVGLIFLIWSTGIYMIPFITDTIDASRTDLACSTTSISFGTKSLCLTIDLVIPYLIWTLALIALGIIMNKN